MRSGGELETCHIVLKPRGNRAGFEQDFRGHLVRRRGDVHVAAVVASDGFVLEGSVLILAMLISTWGGHGGFGSVAGV